MRIKSLVALALMIFAAPFVPTSPAAAEVKILCASGMREIVSEVQTRLGQVAGQEVSISFGEAGDLRRRIQGGEIADVAVLPRIVLDQVAADGNVGAGTIIDISQSSIGIGFARTGRRALPLESRLLGAARGGPLQPGRGYRRVGDAPSSAVRSARKARAAADISRVRRWMTPMGRRNGPSAGGRATSVRARTSPASVGAGRSDRPSPASTERLMVSMLSSSI